ncbi:MAG: 50S ribosomal protein L18 [Mangrovibacterium sp.]|jgi:large subunit ribosomal protein L18
MALTKQERRYRIKMRIRKIVSGTAEKPRLSVFRSNKQIYAQLVDDQKGATVLAVSSLDKEISAAAAGVNKTQQAAVVGKALAEKAKTAGITSVVFDRNGYLYHGRVKQLADAAREGGLKF